MRLSLRTQKGLFFSIIYWSFHIFSDRIHFIFDLSGCLFKLTQTLSKSTGKFRKIFYHKNENDHQYDKYYQGTKLIISQFI